jgi:hypothetical protein
VIIASQTFDAAERKPDVRKRHFEESARYCFGTERKSTGRVLQVAEHASRGCIPQAPWVALLRYVEACHYLSDCQTWQDHSAAVLDSIHEIDYARSSTRGVEATRA